jgi:putative ABC transport system ATP-binding protein
MKGMAKKEQSTVISLRSLTKRYGVGDAEHTVLDGVDLDIKKGEFIAIMGPSGCGKTTLLNILGLLDKPDEGTYHLDEQPVARLTSAKRADIRSRQIGFVFQSFNLVPRLTVLENVALPLTYTGYNRTRSLKIASKMLSTFHLNEREYYMPWQLSGGQTQRVAIARALVNDPAIILADEPTGNLDSKSSHVIMEELSDIHKRGNTIIMVTHNPAMTTYADRVITMLDGRIDTDTSTTTIQNSRSKLPEKPVTLGSRSSKKEPTTVKVETKSNKKPAKKKA